MPLLWCSLAFLGGIFLGASIPWAWPGWALFAGGLPAAALLLTRLPLPAQVRPAPRWLLRAFHPLGVAPVLLAATLFLGAARYQLSQPVFGPHDLAAYHGSGSVRITGLIVSPPEVRDRATRIRVAAQSVRTSTGTFPVRGDLLASLPAAPAALRYGDRIELSGEVQTPPDAEDFSYRDYLARQGIYSEMPFARASILETGRGNPVLAALYAFRERALAVVERIFPPPESSLLAGILLGDDNRLSAGLQQAFRDTGTAHIIAISGFNIAILSGLFARAFSRLLGRLRGIALAIPVIVAYTVLVGAGASVVRAAIMGSLALIAGLIGRRQAGTHTLAVTAAAMCLANPTWLWDVSFQLSFGATLGLTLYAQPLVDWFERMAGRLVPFRIPAQVFALLGDYTLFTLAAQVFTLPVQIAAFQHTSLIALPANFLILPPQPLVMVLGGLAALAGMVWLPAGQALGALAWPFVAYTNRAAEWLAGAPYADIATGPLSPLLAALLVGAALLPALGNQRLARVRSAAKAVLRPAAVLLGVGALAVLVWQGALAQSDRRLRVTVVGPSPQAAVLVQAPGGQTVLIDGGPSASALSQAIGERLGPFRRRLDALVITGNTGEALAGLPATIERFPPETVVWAVPPGSTAAERSLRSGLAGQAITIAAPGLAVDLGEGVQMHFSGVTQTNYPTALLLEWNSFRLALPLGSAGDLPADLCPVSLLVLKEPALKDSASLDAWRQRCPSQLALVRGWTASAPGPGLLSTASYRWLRAATDGQNLWLDGE